jgi:trans-aconitate 2-methyltransferase
MSWSADQYLKFGDERTRPAADLLARVPLSDPKLIVDLGCGPGNSTALLATRYPNAKIIGLDSSADMIAKAKKEGPQGVEWVLADVADWKPEAPPDLIYANALFQWLPNHERLFPRLMSHLRPGGVVAIQMPRNFDQPSHQIIREVAAQGPWAEALKGRGLRDPVADSKTYFALLEPHVKALDIWETDYCQALKGDDPVLNWVKGTALTPYLSAVDSPLKEGFLRELARRLAVAYPRRDSGVTLFPFRRIFIIAVA